MDFLWFLLLISNVIEQISRTKKLYEKCAEATTESYLSGTDLCVYGKQCFAPIKKNNTTGNTFFIYNPLRDKGQ